MTTVNRSRSRLLAAAVLVVVFIAGLASGVIAERTVRPHLAIRMKVAADMSGVLERLSLTPEQRPRAEAIMQRSSPRTEQVMRDAAELLRGVADSVDAELRAILTPEQRATLDSLRPQPQFMLKRKKTGSPTTIDTVYPPPRRR